MTAWVLAACERPPPKPKPVAIPDRLLLTETTFAGLPGWQADPLTEALPAATTHELVRQEGAYWLYRLRAEKR